MLWLHGGALLYDAAVKYDNEQFLADRYVGKGLWNSSKTFHTGRKIKYYETTIKNCLFPKLVWILICTRLQKYFVLFKNRVTRKRPIEKSIFVATKNSIFRHCTCDSCFSARCIWIADVEKSVTCAQQRRHLRFHFIICFTINMVPNYIRFQKGI